MNLIETVLRPARQVKHAMFVSWKNRQQITKSVGNATAIATAPYISKRRSYEYVAARYRHSFLMRNVPDLHLASELPAHVFVVWTGTNELSPARTRNLDCLRTTLNMDVNLVTPDTIDQWVVPGHPFHEAYEYLSLTHRSDYLRAYLLHHHGGGYADLKRPMGSWADSYDEARNDPDAWITGFREVSPKTVAPVPGDLGHDLAINYRDLVGMGAFIVRSHTALTSEWLREVERRLDYFLPHLKEFPGGVRDEVVGYPVPWTGLLGDILHPLQLKYLAHVRIDDRLLMEFHDYV